MIAERVRAHLESKGARFHTVPHEPRFSAQRAAQSAHVSGKHFAKAVLLKRKEEGPAPHYLLAVLPAHENVSLDRVGRAFGAGYEVASEVETGNLFPGIEIGALPALGALAGIPVVADASLRGSEWIVFHGGKLTDLVEMAWDDYVHVAEPRIIEFGHLAV